MVGSPPHVRGPQMVIPEKASGNGITPACAGTTTQETIEDLVLGDHPRMCGDHQEYKYFSLPNLGSPPHVRGPLILWHNGGHKAGITPACAGTTAGKNPGKD